MCLEGQYHDWIELCISESVTGRVRFLKHDGGKRFLMLWLEVVRRKWSPLFSTILRAIGRPNKKMSGLPR